MRYQISNKLCCFLFSSFCFIRLFYKCSAHATGCVVLVIEDTPETATTKIQSPSLNLRRMCMCAHVRACAHTHTHTPHLFNFLKKRVILIRSPPCLTQNGTCNFWIRSIFKKGLHHITLSGFRGPMCPMNLRWPLAEVQEAKFNSLR